MSNFTQPEIFRKKRIPKRFALRTMLFTMFSCIILLLVVGCNDKENTKSLAEGGMKCGAGKCGVSMAGGSAVLIKKKRNILDQMDKNDSRRTCVLNAKNTRALYDCVRDPITGRLVK